MLFNTIPRVLNLPYRLHILKFFALKRFKIVFFILHTNHKISRKINMTSQRMVLFFVVDWFACVYVSFTCFQCQVTQYWQVTWQCWVHHHNWFKIESIVLFAHPPLTRMSFLLCKSITKSCSQHHEIAKFAMFMSCFGTPNRVSILDHRI